MPFELIFLVGFMISGILALGISGAVDIIIGNK